MRHLLVISNREAVFLLIVLSDQFSGEQMEKEQKMYHDSRINEYKINGNNSK